MATWPRWWICAPVAEADFALEQGEDLMVTYESSPGTRRVFCRVCGSRAPARSPGEGLWFVPAGRLEDDPGTRPALHVFVGSKAPWWEITDELPRFEEWVPGYGPEASR